MRPRETPAAEKCKTSEYLEITMKRRQELNDDIVYPKRSLSKLTGVKVLDELKKCGITHIVYLPDTWVLSLYNAVCSKEVMDRYGFVAIPVCREGEALGIATGLMLGGKEPVVLHQNRGLFESGDSVRAFCMEYKMPLFLLISYWGWKRETLAHTAAVLTEPTLDVWGIKHYLVDSDDDLERISMGHREARRDQKAVAILLG
jgi:sulfopyruvate decarboxylase TPP-binding subunit